MTSGIGAGAAFAGMMRTEPLVMTEPLPAVTSFCEERGAMVYAKAVLLCPATVTITGVPFPSWNSALPDIAASVGFTEIILVNPTEAAMSGSAEFHDGNGTPVIVTVAGQSNTAFAYTIAPRSSQKLVTAGSGSVITSGSVRIIPAKAAPAPIPLVIFSYKPGQITLSEA